MWKILRKIGIPDQLTCLLQNLYADQEATVRIRHGTTDWFQIGKGVHQAVYCHPAFSTYTTSHEMLGRMNHKLKIKIAGRNINNLRYVDDTTLMAESEEKLKRLLMNVKEASEKASLKLNIQKKNMASGPITSWQTDGENVETV